METCLILSATRYDFQDDSGKQIQGIKLTYLTDDVRDEGNSRGCFPMSVTAPLDSWDSLEALPGYYDMDFRQRPGPKGKPTLTLVEARFKEPFSIDRQERA